MAAGSIRGVVGPIVGAKNGKTFALVFVDRGGDSVELRLCVQGEHRVRFDDVSRLSAALFLDDQTDPVLDPVFDRLLSGSPT